MGEAASEKDADSSLHPPAAAAQQQPSDGASLGTDINTEAVPGHYQASSSSQKESGECQEGRDNEIEKITSPPPGGPTAQQSALTESQTAVVERSAAAGVRLTDPGRIPPDQQDIQAESVRHADGNQKDQGLFPSGEATERLEEQQQGAPSGISRLSYREAVRQFVARRRAGDCCSLENVSSLSSVANSSTSNAASIPLFVFGVSRADDDAAVEPSSSSQTHARGPGNSSVCCPSCNRSFATKKGLSQHLRRGANNPCAQLRASLLNKEQNVPTPAAPKPNKRGRGQRIEGEEGHSGAQQGETTPKRRRRPRTSSSEPPTSSPSADHPATATSLLAREDDSAVPATTTAQQRPTEPPIEAQMSVIQPETSSSEPPTSSPSADHPATATSLLAREDDSAAPATTTAQQRPTEPPIEAQMSVIQPEDACDQRNQPITRARPLRIPRLTAEAYARLKDKLEELAKATTAQVVEGTWEEVEAATTAFTAQIYDAVWFANKQHPAANQQSSRKPASTNSQQKESRKARVPPRLAQAQDNVKKALLALREEEKAQQGRNKAPESLDDKLKRRALERKLRTARRHLISVLQEESAQQLQTLYQTDRRKCVEQILADEDQPRSQDCPIPLSELETHFKHQHSEQSIDTHSQVAHEFLEPLAAAPDGAKRIDLNFTEEDQ
ncbi:uncharacterized protein EMH_0087780 [Eimeria mitis]|uniref:Uncharacterized protein n=1 Tax=Eimeria mitis TaxID=44415 RepID=U6KF34_9EIME|nr:uncharacterized protein EMH_0087780 [Eimeria mitis]CDJ34088.1 hypothetical protein, conserved [Eimeria mitis]